MIRERHFAAPDRQLRSSLETDFRQVQMSHSYIRSWGFIQIQHVGLIERQTMVGLLFARVHLEIHLYSGKVSANADIYISIGLKHVKCLHWRQQGQMSHSYTRIKSSMVRGCNRASNNGWFTFCACSPWDHLYSGKVSANAGMYISMEVKCLHWRQQGLADQSN